MEGVDDEDIAAEGITITDNEPGNIEIKNWNRISNPKVNSPRVGPVESSGSRNFTSGSD